MTNWKRGVHYPKWYTDMSLQIVSNGYLQENETPKDAYIRIAKTSANHLNMPELEEEFFEVMWNGWLGPATPVFSNMGTDIGLPISCFALSIPDSVDGIYKSVHEMAMLTKVGGGVGLYAGRIRDRGADIKGNGESEGIIPWLKVADSAILATNQGGRRKGAAAVYSEVERLDSEEFLRMRRPEGDINRHCMNLHHGVIITDGFMKRVESGDEEARETWTEIIKTRFETGEPYILFLDNANKANPECYIKNGLRVETSNICTEIMLHTDEEHTFVCDLSSLNWAKYHEWKNWKSKSGKTLPYLGIYLLDAVMTEFIRKGEHVPGLEKAIRSAQKGRAVGLGAMGFHSLLQSERVSVDSLRAKLLNKAITKFMRDEAEKATKDLAEAFGEPEWCKGFNRRNTHVLAFAPTRTNASIVGASFSTEGIRANIYTEKSAKGTFIVKNKELETVLKELGKNTKDVWDSIVEMKGSVQHLDFLSEDLKEVFLTVQEIDQMVFIDLAADRQPYIDQGQSLNLFFNINEDPRNIHKIHMRAWKKGLKTLYYMMTGSVLKANFKIKNNKEDDENCKSCEG